MVSPEVLCKNCVICFTPQGIVFMSVCSLFSHITKDFMQKLYTILSI